MYVVEISIRQNLSAVSAVFSSDPRGSKFAQLYNKTIASSGSFSMQIFTDNTSPLAHNSLKPGQRPLLPASVSRVK